MPIPIQRLAALGARIAFGLIQGEGGATELVMLHLAQSAGTYDPVSDVITPSGGSDVPANAVAFKRLNKQTGAGLQKVEQREFSGDTETLMIRAGELPAGTVIREADTVTRADGIAWNILTVQLDPGKATWLLDVRK